MKKQILDRRRKALITQLTATLSKIHIATGGKGPAWRKAVETVAGLAR